jgi:predicted nucleic acid-binding protein
MRALLDTNIVIHRETSRILNENIGTLFRWLDEMQYIKNVHPITVDELRRHTDPEVVRTMGVKLDSYQVLKTVASLHENVEKTSNEIDTTGNDKNDTLLLNEVYCSRVDLLITEDKKIHQKAKVLGIEDKVFRINSFIEKAIFENPTLVDYKTLSVKKEYFGNIKIEDSFFDSFREDYEGFDNWFNKKAEEISYICSFEGAINAFLFIKKEDETENYSDITPPFPPKNRLKIGTFKVTANGFKLGERFLKIIFDNAWKQKVEEIYVTIFDKREEQKRLISLLENWGFNYHGIKSTEDGDEKVYVKAFKRREDVNIESPKLTYPFLSRKSDVFIVPIYPSYHTELFPDSILNTESLLDFIENKPHRNALSKVYISRSCERNLKSGDCIVFYRTGVKDNAINTGVVTTIGIVESVITDIKDEATFLSLCRKRSVFDDRELKEHWNYNKGNRPFIVNFLYAFSYPKRANLKWLNEKGIIPDIRDMPRGFRKISWQDFINIAKYAFKK